MRGADKSYDFLAVDRRKFLVGGATLAASALAAGAQARAADWRVETMIGKS